MFSQPQHAQQCREEGRGGIENGGERGGQMQFRRGDQYVWYGAVHQTDQKKDTPAPAQEGSTPTDEGIDDQAEGRKGDAQDGKHDRSDRRHGDPDEKERCTPHRCQQEQHAKILRPHHVTILRQSFGANNRSHRQVEQHPRPTHRPIARTIPRTMSP